MNFTLQGDTIRLHYFYADDEPHSAGDDGSHLLQTYYRGSQSIYLMNFNNLDELQPATDGAYEVIELLNDNVELPPNDDTLYWCKMFKLEEFQQKVHIIKVSVNAF